MSFLLIGNSGSGKTSLAIEICQKSDKKKHYIINNNCFSDEYPSKFTVTDWDSVPTLENCSLIFDDCISLTSKEYNNIASTINRYIRHQNILPCLTITHSCMNNNLYGLTRNIPYIIFMTNCHAENVSKLLKASYCFDNREIEENVKKFTSSKESYGFFST